METGALPYASFVKSLRERFTPRHLVYGYANARVRAMRPYLLSRRQAEDILKVKTNAAVAEYLSRTGYRDDFSRMPQKISDEERVELAVSRNFARAAQKLLRITPRKSRPALAAFLGRYDAHNIKTILLSRKLGKSRQEAENLLVPAGSISQKGLAIMLSAKSADELYDSIRGSAFGAEFFSSRSARLLPREQHKSALSGAEGKLELLLSALDSYSYESASASLGTNEKDAALILSLLRSETDAKNVITIMRLKKSGAERGAIMKSLVPGGSFSKAQLGRMASAKGMPEIAALAESFFISTTGKSEFLQAEKRFKEDGSLSHFEVAFERSIARRSLHALRRSMMSLGAIIGFLFLKEEEMNNIRKIVRGKALGLPVERTAEMLVLVG